MYRYHSGVFVSPNIIADKDIIIELTVQCHVMSCHVMSCHVSDVMY